MNFFFIITIMATPTEEELSLSDEILAMSGLRWEDCPGGIGFFNPESVQKK